MKRADFARLGLGLTLIVGLAMAAVHRDALAEAAAGDWLAQAGVWAPLVFVIFYALATVFFLPGSVLTLASGALFGPFGGALYSVAGATIGATLAFLISRHLAGDRVRRKLDGRMGRLMAGVDAEGWRFVAFVRLVPLFPFNLVNYGLGLTRIRLLPYVLASATCMFPGALAYAWLGHAGRETLAGADGAIGNGMLALALVAVVAFLPRLVRRLRSAAAVQRDLAVPVAADAGENYCSVGEVAGAAASCESRASASPKNAARRWSMGWSRKSGSHERRARVSA
jgi:uncharacterized membrane protein YdjX (TVP38/TMEM64 family)